MPADEGNRKAEEAEEEQQYNIQEHRKEHHKLEEGEEHHNWAARILVDRNLVDRILFHEKSINGKYASIVQLFII